MITFGGLPTYPAPAPLAERISRLIPPSDIYQFEHHSPLWAFDGFIPWQPIKLGELRWPISASQWASCHVLMRENDLAQLRLKINNPHQTQELRLYDETTTISAQMWALPARPLFQTDAAGEDLYLLSLVDDRYRWWKVDSTFSVDPASWTWDTLYERIGEALGTPIVTGGVGGNYGIPSTALSFQFDWLPPLLDLVARSTGRVIVRDRNGTVTAMTPTNSKAIQDGQDRAFRRIAGGQFKLP